MLFVPMKTLIICIITFLVTILYVLLLVRPLLCDGQDKLEDDSATGGPYDELQVSSSSSSLQANNNAKPLYARKGKHLCNMDRERFVNEAPPFLGDILWEHLEMMQRGERNIIMIFIYFFETSILCAYIH